jgi:hypothetical protein
MAVESNVFVKITSEYNGKALDKGKKQLTEFEKLTKKVGKTLGAAFAAHKIIAFGQSAVKAFIDSEKAGKALNQTLNNLGMAYKSPAIDMYLNKLSLQVGIVDEQLKPAYNSLLIATHDTAMAQSLLNTALDVSAGTGKDLSSVIAALSKGYLGNNTALQRLGVGLSKAELQGSNFADIVKILNGTFQGQAAYAAQGYTGDIAKLGVAYDQLRQSIGKGILTGLNDVGSIDQTTESIVSLGNAIGFLTGNISKFVIGNLQLFQGSTWIKFWNDLTGKTVINPYAGSDRGGASKMADARAEKLSKVQANTAKLQTTAAKAQTAATKAQTLLNRSGTVLDVQQAEIYAALQGKITDNEKLRLDLQLALITKNATAADQLSQQLLVSQLQTTDLAKTISTLPKALNPFAEWPSYIQNLINMIAGMNALINQKTNTATQQIAVSLPNASSGLGQAINSGQIDANLTKDILTGANPNAVAERERLAALASGQSQSDAASVARWTGQAIAYFESQLASQQAAGQTITVNIDASSMIDPSNLTKVIQQTYIDLQKGGYSLAPGGYGFGGG